MPAKSSSKSPKTKASRSTLAQSKRGTPPSPSPAQDRDTQKKPDGFLVVGIGASAGGLESFTKLLQNLPRDTGMAFVLIQHLNPDYKSQLSELLARSAHLPVQVITGGMRLQPRNVYVMPPHANVTLEAGAFKLQQRRRDSMNMPVDLFLRSLAREEGNRAIGVLLSGTGADGTLGMQMIKAEGGITFAQDEKSSGFSGMTSSAVAADCVDFVLPLDALARELVSIAAHPCLRLGKLASAEAVTQISTPELEAIFRDREEQLHAIFALLRARVGVDFSLYKHNTLRRRIVRRMALNKLGTLDAYLKLLQNDLGEGDALFRDLLINVTSFFRDPQVFLALRRKVFPRLMKHRVNEAPLRFWVVGCATGEEAYSLAISLVECFDATHTHMSVQIFATDISEDCLEKARLGFYPESIALDVSPERLRRFFIKTEGGYQVSKLIRDMCIFARQNLVTDPPFSNLDLISCRNVLIYLRPVLQKKIMPTFHYALKSTGCLLLGSSETIGTSTEMFNLLDKKNRIFTKKQHYIRPFISHMLPMPGAPDLKDLPQLANRPGPSESKVPELNLYADRLILSRFSPAAVVVNLQMDVLYFRGRTGHFLEHAAGAASLNLLKMVRESLAMDLRTAISRALKQDLATRHEGSIIHKHGSAELVDFEVVPFRLTPTSDRFLLVIFDYHRAHTPEAGAGQKSPRAGKVSPQAENREVGKLRQDLAATRESLQAIIEEQEATNEELKSANEEIQSSNEELQSTNEELETAKEELQSTNEELTTLNEELQTRNTELSQVNNDLLNLLSNVHMAVVMLGTDLTIRRFTPMAEKIFNLIPSDIGRRLSDLNRTIVVPDLDEQIRKVIDHLATVEQDIQDRHGRWFSMRIRPYRTRENRIEGAVLMLIDIHSYKLSLDQVIQNVRQPLAALYGDMRIRMANAAFCELLGAKKEDLLNQFVFKVCHGRLDKPALRHALAQVTEDRQAPGSPRLEIGTPAGPRVFAVQLNSIKEDGRTDFIMLSLEPNNEGDGK